MVEQLQVRGETIFCGEAQEHTVTGGAQSTNENKPEQGFRIQELRGSG